MPKELSCFLIDNDIDDQEIFALALQEIDNAISYRVANDGVSAIKKLTADTAYKPSFIFIDMNMPLMNGKQCLHEIKRLPHLSEVPVYIYSTSADPRSIKEVKHSGAAGFIIKPPSFTELVTTLTKILLPQNLPANYNQERKLFLPGEL